jgi:hypothetical protein
MTWRHLVAWGVAAACGLSLVGAEGCRAQGRPLAGGLVLVVSHEAPDATLVAPDERPDVREAAASLTVGAWSDVTAEALAKEIHRWRVLVDIAHNPLSVDLEDDDLDARMKSTYAELAPRLTAATSLLGGRWRADDGLTVQVARTCRSGELCVELDAEPTGDRTEARARFLAWPIASAVHVRTASGRAKAVADELRRRTESPTSAISLVVDRSSLAADSAAGMHVQAEARGLLEALGSRGPAHRKALARSFAGGALPAAVAPWLTPGDDEILLVPRLAYLGRMPELLAEARGLIAGLGEADVSLAEPASVPGPKSGVQE